MKFLFTLFLAALALGQAPSPVEKEQIRARLAQLTKAIDDLRHRGVDDARLADVEIYHKAATWILRFDEEFYSPKYFADTMQAIDHGLVRATDTRFSWESKKGRVVRAYRSRVDDSIQPYVLVIPDSYDGAKAIPLKVVLHDRDERLNEIAFITAHETGGAATQDSIQLDVFGRGNNGYRWAGETDVFEAIESVRSRYRIDDRRITLRGSGMGATGAWHLGLHYPDRWAAVEANGGFTETKRTAKLGPIVPYQDAALKIYDAVEYAANAAMVPITGDNDDIRQRLVLEGVRPLQRPAGDAPDHIHFVTYTTAYSHCYWISIEGMDRQYERAEVDAQRRGEEVRVTTRNVSRLKIEGAKLAIVDGQAVGLPGFGMLSRTENGWRVAAGLPRYKRPGLQGPIDDAFRDAFLCVRPTGKPENKDVGEFTRQMLEQFRREFAKWMRGDIRIKDDRDVNDDDIARYHLVLFGDRSSNRLIKKVAEVLVRSWPDGPIVPTLIAPNPLNHDRYVVLNSGHTFHEPEFKGGEALLYPRLGDFALIDAWGREVIRGGLFNASWRQLVRFPSPRQ